jgi:plastocyanin
MKQMDRSAVLAVLVAGALVSSCGGGGGGNSAPTAPNPPTANPGTPEPAAMVVGIVGDRGSNSFSPNPAAARIGQKVQWRNNDRVLHRIVQDRAGDDGNNSGDPYGGGGGQGGSGGTGFDGGDTAPEGMSSAMTLSAAGTLRYHCAIHPGMVGSIVVQ